MFRSIYALICATALVCLPALGQTGFIPVTQSHLTDSNGNAAVNMQVCAQAVSDDAKPTSVRVGTSAGVTTTSQVCANVNNGAWSMSLPDGSQSAPLNATWSFSAIDNLTGQNLLAGYSKVQPHSQTCTATGTVVSCTTNRSDDWCSASSCTFDKLAPSAPAMAVMVQGIKGDTGDAATVQLGTVTTSAPNTDVIITNSGDNHNAILNFTVPKGPPGSNNGGGSYYSVQYQGLDSTLSGDTVARTDGNGNFNFKSVDGIGYAKGFRTSSSTTDGCQNAFNAGVYNCQVESGVTDSGVLTNSTHPMMHTQDHTYGGAIEVYQNTVAPTSAASSA